MAMCLQFMVNMYLNNRFKKFLELICFINESSLELAADFGDIDFYGFLRSIDPWVLMAVAMLPRGRDPFLVVLKLCFSC